MKQASARLATTNAIFRLSPRQVLIKFRHVGRGMTPAVSGCGNYSVIAPSPNFGRGLG